MNHKVGEIGSYLRPFGTTGASSTVAAVYFVPVSTLQSMQMVEILRNRTEWKCFR